MEMRLVASHGTARLEREDREVVGGGGERERERGAEEELSEGARRDDELR